MKENTLLDKVETPSDLRQLSPHELPQLCDELRAYLIEAVSSCGGHFAAGLGAIELSVALHYVFNTPDDLLVWDVGHQCYPHKILCGRKSEIINIRKRGGLAPFPKRHESKYDTFGVGHSSTSVSAAMGMALGAMLRKENRKTVAIIGDGGLTAGLAYEAMNHLGSIQADIMIVLNDNDMSISPNVGAMSNYLTRIISSPLYKNVMEKGKRILKPPPQVDRLVKRTREHIKGMIVPGTLFEELGISYYGPIDGHDVLMLVNMFQNLKLLKQPRLIHTITRKGKGYLEAEKDPVKYHAVSRFNPRQGMDKSTAKKLTYTQIFSDWICHMAEKDKRLVAITPAMREGSGLVEFEKRFTDRYFDVGIAEQHALTLAAGLACAGLKPVVAIYSTFLQRAYDQLVHDIAIQNLPVMLAIDRAGVVGPDGPTHAGSFDLSFLRCIPNMVIMAPMDERMTRLMLSTAYMHDGPTAVRYPRGSGWGTVADSDLAVLKLGRGKIIREGRKIAILGFGSLTGAALIAAEKHNASVADMRFIKPLDTQLIEKIANSHEHILTIEDNTCIGGAGSAVSEFLKRINNNISLTTLGLPDRFQEHGTRDELLTEAGLDVSSIENTLQRIINDH